MVIVSSGGGKVNRGDSAVSALDRLIRARRASRCFLHPPGLNLFTRRECVMATAKQPLITSTPDILGGTPVFRGTRVPVQTLIEYLEGGQTIDEFLDGFPTVSR